MPVTNDPAALRASLLAALQSKSYDPATRTSTPGLSGNEVDKLLSEIKKDGVTDAEVKVVVETLVDALKSGYDTTAPREQKSIGRLLDTLDRLKPGVIADKAQFTNNGAVSWLSLLQARAAGTAPSPPPPPPPGPAPVTPTPTPSSPTSPTGTLAPLPAKGFDGKALAVSSSGEVVVDGKVQSLALKTTTDATPLLALLKPTQLSSLDAASKAALATKLVDALAAGLPIPADSASAGGAPKLQACIASLAALGALVELAPSLTAAQADTLASLSTKTPSLMQEALLRKALAAAPTTPSTTAALSAAKAKDTADKVDGEADNLLKAYDTIRGEGWKAEWNEVKGPATTTALTCLAFASQQVAVDNIGKGLAAWAKMDGAGYGLTADKAAAAQKSLQPYIDNAASTNLVFGAFVSDAPKNIAAASNAVVVARVGPALDGSKPVFAGVPLSADQAVVVKALLPGLKDDAAVTALGRALTQAAATFSTTTSTWGTPPPPKEPLSPAAFAIFARGAVAAFDARSGTVDGMLDARSLETSVTSDAKAIGDTVKPLLLSLSQGTLRDGATLIPTSPALAQELTKLLTNQTRSIMSAPNVLAAAVVVANKNGGKLDGAGAAQLSKILSDYCAEFPKDAAGAQLLDFNKLARIASFAVDGKAVPLCTINGQQVKLAELYSKVAEAVVNTIDKTDLRQPWMADRWGQRAKTSVELLDVIAQKTAEGRGPITVLQQQFPAARINVIATGRDGEHQRFIYEVNNNGVKKTFAEASDGGVQTYDIARQGSDPVLFTAAVKADGSFDVAVPTTTRKMPKYPLQVPYGPGTRIDVGYYDTKTPLVNEEGKPFQSPHKVAEGRITGYTANGGYKVEYNDADGKLVQKDMTIDDIRKYNSPHWFSTRGDRFSDVTINIQTDKDLKAFLDGADPIIARFLPQDGSLMKLSPQEIAKKQRECVAALMQYTHERVSYPNETANADPDSQAFMKLEKLGMFDLGRVVKLKKGVCRHQCILEHLLLQKAGIDSRLASGSANTSSGAFRGLHIWTELTLADGARFLSDQTWNDVAIPLWDGAYNIDKERVEMYDRTSRYDSNIVS